MRLSPTEMVLLCISVLPISVFVWGCDITPHCIFGLVMSQSQISVYVWVRSRPQKQGGTTSQPLIFTDIGTKKPVYYLFTSSE